MITLIITAVLSVSPEPLTDAKLLKLLASPKEAERIAALESVKSESPKIRKAVESMAENDPSHGVQQIAIKLLARIGEETSAAALQRIGAKHCICEKLAFQSLLQIARRSVYQLPGKYEQVEPESIKAARKLQVSCDNESLKEEMGKALETWKKQ